MNRLTSWPSARENISSGVNARQPYRPLSLLPGPPNAFDNRPVVLLSVGGIRSLLVMNVVEPSRSMRAFGFAATLARMLTRRKALGCLWSPGTSLICRIARTMLSANSGIFV